MDFIAILFAIKKGLGALLSPIPLALCAILVAVMALKRYPSWARLMLLMAFVMLAGGAWHPIADRLVQSVENHYPVFDISQPVDAVVVLGSSHSSSPDRPPMAQLNSPALFRLSEGLRILRHNPAATLFLSGYAGSDPVPHAEIMRQAALSVGIAEGRIRTYPLAQDTEDEAQQMAPVLKQQRVALVSDAAHLPRAVVFFRQYGIDVIPAPALWLAAETSDWRVNSLALIKTERWLYEVLGGYWQAIKLYWRALTGAQ